MYDEAEIHKNKLPNKTYISSRVDTIQGPLRIASKVIDSEGLHYAKVKDEVVLRRTQTGRTEIVVKFLEDDRQLFFEHNPWVFGYGLSYFFVTGFENKKLEQVVKGHDLINHGKRADGLMKTRGIINSLCFVEIKTHEMRLLDASPYRAGCWAPSKELSGAVAQVQGTVASAMQNLYGMLLPTDKDGAPTGEEVFNFRPRAFIVVGSLGEFVTEHGVNVEQLRSFELYRNSIAGIDILTYDELYERSKFIVDSAT